MNPEVRQSAPRPIDWQEVHRRLDQCRNALTNSEPGPEFRKKILNARARALAQEARLEVNGRESVEVVEFILAYERYAIESAFIREVYTLKELTPLPGAPPFVSGIVNVRGRIVCVINLKTFFNLPEKGLTDLNKIIIIGNDHQEFGLLADAVTGTACFPNKTLQASLPTLTGVRLDYLKGVTDECVVVLDASKLLSDPRLATGAQQSAPNDQQRKEDK